jgi:hypothetical protein
MHCAVDTTVPTFSPEISLLNGHFQKAKIAIGGL